MTGFDYVRILFLGSLSLWVTGFVIGSFVRFLRT